MSEDVLTIDRAEQLRALGHPLRLRVIEILGEGEALTNRQLAKRLGIDPGHLHFHVRLLHKAGLIELAPERAGREKPYRVVAPTIRVDPELLASGAATDAQAALIDEVQRGWVASAREGAFRGSQLTVRISLDEARELFREFVERAAKLESADNDPVVITLFLHPPAPRD